MPQSPDEMAAAMVANMNEKTGRSIDEWVVELKGWEDRKHGEVVKHLKTEYGITHGYATMITHIFRDGPNVFRSDGDELVDKQYAGPKEGLRPIYEELISKVGGFGNDLEVRPKQAYVSLRRNKQFGTIKPATKTRMDIGINLKGEAGQGRLTEMTAANVMVSHQVQITSLEEVDAELLAWLKEAYERA